MAKKIEAAIPRLSRGKVEELRIWIEDYLGEQFEPTADVKAKLDASRAEITAGNFTRRRPA